ncbi:hypothetical protein EPN87_03710 [archaeon]|nr:MAG: hypothetical protein EPN87_03710 [archaeon]
MRKEDHHRLYFIIRSFVMSQIGGDLYLAGVLILGTVNFIQALVLGTVTFIASLAISRFGDPIVNKIVEKILHYLDKRAKIKRLILKYF